MKKLVSALGVALALTLASAPSFATSFETARACTMMDQASGKCKPKKKEDPGTVVSPDAVPEIDAASAGLALALMGGIVAIRRERRK